MAVHIIMDRSGDTRHEFDVKDRVSLEAAEARFRELTGRGFMAVAVPEDGGPGKQLKAFDETAERVMFVPALIGG
jgi:hypothetical protein